MTKDLEYCRIFMLEGMEAYNFNKLCYCQTLTVRTGDGDAAFQCLHLLCYYDCVLVDVSPA